MTEVIKQRKRVDWILVIIAILSGFLNYFNVWNQNSDNSYYTSAVTSMLQSFHNFFFASFDPGGYVTVDKPPVVFWIQTAFASVFGVHSWSVILPQALAQAGSVLLLYFLVKPTFGKIAARLVSLIMAVTPIAVAVSRTNNIDSMLVFTLLLATWMLVKGIRNKKIGWILGAFAMIGVGFNEKMLQAYFVVPAFYLFYIMAFKEKAKKKWTVLAASTAIMLVVSLSWAVIVDSIPEKDRPYMGSSQTNSVLELAFGYNGVSRLTGNQGGGMGGAPNQQKMQQSEASQNQQSKQTNSTKQNQNQQNNNTNSNNQPNGNFQGMPPNGGEQGKMFGGRSGGQGGGMFNTGLAGPLRLFQTELSGQISWLLPFVIISSIGLLAGIRCRKPWTDKQKETVFWLAWLIPGCVFFSIAGFFHQYYLIMLAPPIAAIAGAGWVELWNHYRTSEGWKKWLLPIGILITTLFELYILYPYQDQIGIGWSIVIGLVGIVLSLLLFFASKQEQLSSFSALAGLLILLVGPLYWASTGVISGVNSVMPAAGPSGGQGFSGGGMPNMTTNTELSGSGMGMNMPNGNGFSGNGNAPQMRAGENNANAPQGNNMSKQPQSKVVLGASQINTKLFNYVTKHNTGEKFLFATTSSQGAAPYIIKTGKAVMAMGGFSGSDPILTVAKLEEMVKNKQVKFFLIPSGTESGFRGEGSSEVLNWIRSHSTKVADSEWKSSQDTGTGMKIVINGTQVGGSDEALYEIKQ